MKKITNSSHLMKNAMYGDSTEIFEHKLERDVSLTAAKSGVMREAGIHSLVDQAARDRGYDHAQK